MLNSGVQFPHDLRWYFERFHCTPKGTFTQQFDQSVRMFEESSEIQYIPIKLIKMTTPKNWQNLGKRKNKKDVQALWRWRNPGGCFWVFSRFVFLGFLGSLICCFLKGGGIIVCFLELGYVFSKQGVPPSVQSNKNYIACFPRKLA